MQTRANKVYADTRKIILLLKKKKTTDKSNKKLNLILFENFVSAYSLTTLTCAEKVVDYANAMLA